MSLLLPQATEYSVYYQVKEWGQKIFGILLKNDFKLLNYYSYCCWLIVYMTIIAALLGSFVILSNSSFKLLKDFWSFPFFSEEGKHFKTQYIIQIPSVTK